MVIKKLSSLGDREGFSNGQLACSCKWQMYLCRTFSKHWVSSSVTLSRVTHTHTHTHTHKHTHTHTASGVQTQNVLIRKLCPGGKRSGIFITGLESRFSTADVERNETVCYY